MSVALALVVLVGCTSASGGNQAAPPLFSSAPPTTSPLVPTSVANGVRVQATTAPAGFDVPGAQWIAMDRADGRRQLAAVFVPDGPGPFPTVVYLHGSSGLARSQLQWLPRLADAGYLVLAGCYRDAANPIAFLPCDGLPKGDEQDATSTANGYDTLVRTAHALGSARPGKVGIVGVSLGAITALSVTDDSVAAIVADSGYGPDAAAGEAPVLLLGFTNDPQVSHDQVVAYEEARRSANKPVESHYYEGTGHVATLGPATADDAIQRTIAFLDAHLKPG